MKAMYLRLFQINYFNSNFFVKLLIKPASQQSQLRTNQFSDYVVPTTPPPNINFSQDITL